MIRRGRPRRGLLVVVGDVLLDREVTGTVDRLCPEAPVPVLAEHATWDRPGGAGLAALLAAGDTPGPWEEVVLVGAVGADEPGDRLRALLAAAGIRLIELRLHGQTPEKVRMRCGGHLLLRLDRGGGPPPIGDLTAAARSALRGADALLVSDYGRGVAAHPELRRALAGRRAGVPLVWDPHPGGGDPIPGVDLATPNRAEADAYLPGYRPADRGIAAATLAAVRLRHRWAAAAVAVTLGERGAVLSDGRKPARPVPAPLAAQGDPCGAGDRLASAAVAALAGGASAAEAVADAVAAAAAYVAAGGAAALQTPPRAATAAIGPNVLAGQVMSREVLR